ncbi:MAG: mandelate racemase/muconate lactonizing enzyme family protein [Candidatus Latescibacterota bacterium]|jgi:L-rhamnonate dehydratase
MKITRVEALHLRLPEVREVADGTQDCLLVRIETDAGISGLGEVVSGSYVARAVVEAPRSAPFRHGLAQIVEGMDPLDTEAVFQAMVAGTYWYGPGGVSRHAMSGIDMALWDIKGKAAGKSVRHLLSASAVDSVPAYASVLWPANPELVDESARQFLAQGYRAVKYGWAPMGPDAALDEELVAAARQALGAEVDLMVDAGRAWDADTALARAERFAAYDIYWLEEPLAPYDTDGFTRLAAASPVPIATGEVLALQEEYQPLIAEANIHVVQPDLGRIGGITQGQHLAASCRGTGKTRPVPHAFGTGVLLAASAQWAAALDQPLTEYTRAPSPLAQNLARHDMQFKDGLLHLSDAPGLGVELDEHVVAQYRIA